MASAYSAPRINAFASDPHENLVIITPEKRDDAGPHDRVDATHALCEKAERPISPEEIRDVNTRGILQAIRIVRDGTDLGLVVMGRRRVRMARAVNDLRHEWNKGRTNWLFETARLEGEAEKPFLTVPSMLIQGSDLELRGAMLAENIQRADYSPLQTAEQIKAYIDMGASVEVAVAVSGKKKWFVDAHLALLDCSAAVQKAVETGKMQVTAARKIADLPRDQQDAALAEVMASGKKMTAQEAKRQVKKARHGENADNSPSKGEVARMLALLQGDAGEMTPKERSVSIEILQWVRSGKRPSEFKLPKLSTPLPKAEK